GCKRRRYHHSKNDRSRCCGRKGIDRRDFAKRTHHRRRADQKLQTDRRVELPEYELQKLSFPPILQMLDYIQRENFSEIIISTPGPVGLTGLLAAKMLNLQTSGIYHTDFTQYIRILTDDSFLESVAWRYLHWLYAQLDTVY